MKLVYALVFFSLVGMIIPANAQYPRIDEREEQFREDVRICKAEVDAKDFTEAESTVAKRNCEREITIRYSNVNNDFIEQAELRAKFQNIQRCEDWHPQYRYLTEVQFKIQKTDAVVKDCILLYNDSIWIYVGEDRPYKLLDRLEEIKSELPDIPEPTPVAINIQLPQYESSIIDTPQSSDRVGALEEKVKMLQEELEKKDQVIKEQLKVIMDLFNRIRNVIFEPIGFVWSQA